MSARSVPRPAGRRRPDRLRRSETTTQIALFHQQGYLVIHDAFTGAEVAGALAGLLDLIGGTYPAYRGIQYEKNTRDLVAALPASRSRMSVRKLLKMVEHEQRIAALAQHPQMIALLARLIGDTPELFQDQALLKPPLIGREKPWHQDNAYFNLPPETAGGGRVDRARSRRRRRTAVCMSFLARIAKGR